MGITTVDQTASERPDATACADTGRRQAGRACARRASPVATDAAVAVTAGRPRRLAQVGSGLLALLVLAACTATGSHTVAPIPATAETVSPQCPAWVTPCVGAPARPLVGDVGDLPRLVQAADDLLFAGDEKGAWQQLNEALKIDPKHRPALLLMSQITDDPRKLLGDMTEPYTVGKGESLRQIAAARLGDARLFYALARYNQIPVPRQLDAGRSILLPLPPTGAGPLRAGAAGSTPAGAPARAPAPQAAPSPVSPPPASSTAAPTPAAVAETPSRPGSSATTPGAGGRGSASGTPGADPAGAGARSSGAATPGPAGSDAELA
ncbi:MAG: hypothetical protein RL375_3205, partial [Pseudomonadota bacterium]